MKLKIRSARQLKSDSRQIDSRPRVDFSSIPTSKSTFNLKSPIEHTGAVVLNNVSNHIAISGEFH